MAKSGIMDVYILSFEWPFSESCMRLVFLRPVPCLGQKTSDLAFSHAGICLFNFFHPVLLYNRIRLTVTVISYRINYIKDKVQYNQKNYSIEKHDGNGAVKP